MPLLLALLAALPQAAPEDLEKRCAPLAARLEGLRGLKFKTPLKAREATRREYAAFALENAKRVYGADLDAAAKGLKAMGLVPGRMRLDLAITLNAGMGVKAWCSNGEILVLDRAVTDDLLLNKMDLGLVDQHFAPKIAETFDGQMAWAATRMGDAEAAKHLMWHSGKMPEGWAKRLADEAAAWEKGDSKLASSVVPRLFVRTGDFSWRRGGVFAATLHAAGGRPALDKALASPPISTEQVLHPEKYAAGERPVEISLAPADAFLAVKGYNPVYRTALGELGTALVLEAHFSKEDLSSASEGWGGDAFAVYEKEGAGALVLWVTAWDSEKDATEYYERAARLPLAPAPLSKSGAFVVLGVNVPEDLRAGLAEAATSRKDR